VLALLISYRTYANAKPKLKVTLKKCEHRLVEDNKIVINSQLSISNCGDRPITLNEIEVRFTQNGKNYEFKKEMERKVYDEDSSEEWISKMSVNPHETTDEWVYFEGSVAGIQQEIDCYFKIYHTRGTCSFKATSKRMKQHSEEI